MVKILIKLDREEYNNILFKHHYFFFCLLPPVGALSSAGLCHHQCHLCVYEHPQDI